MQKKNIGMYAANMVILPHQPKWSHFLVPSLSNQIGLLPLLAHSKGSGQIKRQIELHSGKNSYSLCHTIQARMQTNPERSCSMHQEKLSTKLGTVHVFNLNKNYSKPYWLDTLLYEKFHIIIWQGKYTKN